jgi:hypothetical protein
MPDFGDTWHYLTEINKSSGFQVLSPGGDWLVHSHTPLYTHGCITLQAKKMNTRVYACSCRRLALWAKDTIGGKDEK